MSRRSAPDSPWQNGMPPFGLCQQQFNPMLNCTPMWAQPGLPFMGGGMAPDMMRFGGNVSSRSNFRRNYDQPDRYSRPRQPYGERSGNRPSPYGRGDRKRPASGHRSRSPTTKKGKRVDGARKAEQGKPKGAEGVGEEEQDEVAPTAELYDPAEPTSEDAGDGVEQAEGKEENESGAALQEETTEGGDGEAKDDAENDESAPHDESGDMAEGKQVPPKPAGKPAAKPGGGAAKASDTKLPAKGANGRPADKRVDGTARSDKEQGAKRGGQKGKGWCTVCEVHFEGNFLDHRRTEEHKTKRDEKYPKCHPCSMGFNNRVQYEQHCAGEFHRKNVEVLDNEVDETAGPLGEEYLEEVPAFFCTLCKLLLKADLKTQHCCTQGHYRRHRDVKRKEEAALKAKLAKEKQAEDEEEDVSQMAFTVTDEIVSDDEAKAASDATGESSKKGKVDKPAELPPEEDMAQQDGEPEAPMEEAPGAEQLPKAEEQPEPEVQVKIEQVKAELQEGAESKELLECEAELAAAALDDSGGDAIPDTNGCKSMEEEGDEQQAPATATAPVPKAPRAPVAAAKATPVPKTPKVAPTPAKVPPKNVPSAKAAAASKPLAKPGPVTPKPAATTGTPKPATRIPAAKAGTAVSSTVVTSAPAASATAVPGKKPPAVATVSEPAAAAGTGGMARGRGRGTPKAVRGVGARKR